MTTKRAFVLMPFSQDFNDVYDFLIKTPLENAGYSVSRADDLLNQSNILQDIISGIANCDLIIADLSKSNPNVYYEVGLAHAMRKKVVLITQNLDEIPFDLRSYRIIVYSTHFSEMNEAQQKISELVKKELNNELTFSSPVVDFGATNPNFLAITSQSTAEITSNHNDRGVLDIQVDLEESNEVMGLIISEVGDRWAKLTPHIQTTTAMLSNRDGSSSKEQVKAMRELSKDMDAFSDWLKTKNVNYQVALQTSKECLDSMFSGDFNMNGDAATELNSFVDILGGTADATISAKSNFEELVETMDNLQKIEKQFDRANNRMSTETKVLIDNITQTASVLSRARMAAKNLLETI